MKKFLAVLVVPCLLMTGCLKEKIDVDHDGSALVAFAGGSPDSLAQSNLGLASNDTLNLYVEVGVETPYVLNKTITMRLVHDDSKRVAYNQTHFVQYDSLPDSLYSFHDTTVTLPAGQRSVGFYFQVYAAQANLKTNYMFPVTITNADGTAIDPIIGTKYFNQLETPLSGEYYVTGTRTDYQGPMSAGVVQEVVDLSTLYSKFAVTDSVNEVFIDYSDLGPAGWQYNVTYYPNNSGISMVPNSVMMDLATGYSEGTFISYVQTYDPINKILHFKTQYTDYVGDDRVVDEYLTEFR